MGLRIFIAVFFGALLGGVGQLWAAVEYGAAGLWLIPIVMAVIFVGGLIGTAVSARLSGGAKEGLTTASGWVLRVVGAAAGIALVWLGISLIVDFTPDCVPSETVRCVGIRNGQEIGDVTAAEQGTSNFFVALMPMVPGVILFVVVVRSTVNALRRA